MFGGPWASADTVGTFLSREPSKLSCTDSATMLPATVEHKELRRSPDAVANVTLGFKWWPVMWKLAWATRDAPCVYG